MKNGKNKTPLERLRGFLAGRRQKTVLLDELQRFCGGMEYEVFHQAVRELETAEVLQGIKAAGQDFGGLSRKYKIFAGRLFAAGTEQIQQEIQQDAMSSLLDFSWYYRQSIDCWQQERPWLRKLSVYLKRQQTRLESASVQQRSYEIFGDEKFLLERGHVLLSHVGLQEAELGIGGQPDPLMLAVNPRGLGLPVCQHLVVENKAPYYGLLSFWLQSDFTSVIFGSGWKIAGNIQELPQQCGQPEKRHIVWYFGDFDWEGLSIWHSLSGCRGMEVRLAEPFYQAFLNYGPSTGKQNQQKNPVALDAFCSHFSVPTAERWRGILQGKGYYPQETLSGERLQKCWEEFLDEAGKFS